MKTYISLILIFIATGTFAQSTRPYIYPAPAFDEIVWNCGMHEDYTNQITVETDIFGDRIKTLKDERGHTLLSIKRTKDIFGSLITTVSNSRMQILLALEKSKDIFGAEIIKITGPNHKLLGTYTQSTDVMGDRKTEIRDIAHNKTTVITVSTDIFHNQKISIKGPRNSYEDMVAGFMEELEY